jgi:glucokinase
MVFIGVDLGGTLIKAGLVTDKGEILKKETAPTPVEEGFEGVVKAIIRLVENLLKNSQVTKEDVKGVGVGAPGTCSRQGLVYFAPNLFWKEAPLADRLKECWDWNIYIENDATVAALAESAIGATKEAQNSVFITLGTGVGGGLIINGQIYNGSYGMGSEIGHMIIGENSYDCTCGNNGCLETFASATALVKYTGKLLEEKQESLILEMVNNNMDLLNAKLIFDCAKAGDSTALIAVKRLIKYLAIGMGNIISVLDPEIIAIGGGMSKAGDFLLEQLKREVPKYIYDKNRFFCKITFAQLENDAGIIGSALYAKWRGSLLE